MKKTIANFNPEIKTIQDIRTLLTKHNKVFVKKATPYQITFTSTKEYKNVSLIDTYEYHLKIIVDEIQHPSKITYHIQANATISTFKTVLPIMASPAPLLFLLNGQIALFTFSVIGLLLGIYFLNKWEQSIKIKVEKELLHAIQDPKREIISQIRLKME